MYNIDKNSKVPLHIQLFNEIKNEILKSLKVGDKLDSIRKICLNYNLSKNTVENAYSQLVAEGYIESIPKSGFFVSDILYSENYSKKIQKIKKVEKLEYLYDFYPARLSKDTFPLKSWKRIYNKTITEDLHLGMYQDGQGEFGLREQIAKYLVESRGVNCEANQVIICSGFPNAASLLSRLFKKEHTSLAMEDPGYYVIKGVFEDYNYDIEKISLESDGINIEQLEESNSRLLYITPSHQYPTGVRIPISKRMKLLSWANKNDAYIIEDDYDSELSFVNRPIPSLQGLDKNQRVIYTGTFSKSFSAAIRVSYVVLPNFLIKRYYKFYDSAVSRVDYTLQKTLEVFMKEKHWDKHLRKIRTISKKKHNLMKMAIKKYLKDSAKILSSGAGLSIVIYPNGNFDWEKLRTLGEKNRIKIYTPKEILLDNWDCVRLGFGGFLEDEIENAIEAFSIIWFESFID